MGGGQGKLMRVLLDEHDTILRSYQAQKRGGYSLSSNWLLLPMRHRRWRMRKGYAHAELDEAGEWSGRAGEVEEKGQLC